MLFSEQNPATRAVRIIGTVHSEVGRPCSLAPALEMPIELLEGDEYDGWVVPFTLATDILTLFSIFGLWQSSNGLMTEGKKHISMRRGVGTAITLEPVLVGDFLDGRQVKKSIISYSDASRLYTVRVEHGEPPEALEITPVQYRYYESILTSDRTIATEMINLVNQLFMEVLPLVKTVDQKPLDISAATAKFMSLKKSAEQSIEQALEEQEARQWHL